MTVAQLDDYYEPEQLRARASTADDLPLPQGPRHRERLRAAARPRRLRPRRPDAAERVRALCDRRAGIGGDGVLRVVRARVGPTPSGSWTTATPTARSRRCAATASGCSPATSSTRAWPTASAPIPIGTRDGVKVLTVDGDLITADMGTPEGARRDRRSRSASASWPAPPRRHGQPARGRVRRRPRRRRAAARRRPSHDAGASTRTASTSSSSYAAATRTSRCGCTSAAPARPAPAAPAPAR